MLGGGLLHLDSEMQAKSKEILVLETDTDIRKVSYVLDTSVKSSSEGP